MTQLSLPQVTQPASLERVRFRDGMIVYADDLDRAVQYPVDMFRMLVRAFFGCGIVCGLEVQLKKNRDKSPERKGDPNCGDAFSVVVKRGVAVDCAGYPIELCRDVVIDVRPGPSSCQKPECVCILIRRLSSEESPRRPCGCGDEPASDDPCGGVRVKEHVQIKVFDCRDLPACVCQHEKPRQDTTGTETRSDICRCLQACGACTCGSDACCDNGWVLLGCVEFSMENGQPMGIDTIDLSHRRYVKPIDCLCRRDAPEPPSEECPPTGDDPDRPTEKAADPMGLKEAVRDDRKQQGSKGRGARQSPAQSA